MNANVAILQRLVSGSEAFDEAKLNMLRESYPYYSPLVLLQALSQPNGEVSEADRQKLALHFPDRIWLDFLLRKEEKTQSSPEPAPLDNNSFQNTVAETATVTDKTEAAITEHSIVIDDESDEEQEQEGEKEFLPELAELKIPAPVIPKETVLSFEPYHTIDYFASQGIKFREDERPNDKFGQQLKSFTEWLKTLKKGTEAATGQPANKQEEQKVEQMAEQSLSEGKVVTEAMAEVWEKQGNYEKAIEIYRKLSLLNPAKSSYFAAKIDQLKQL